MLSLSVSLCPSHPACPLHLHLTGSPCHLSLLTELHAVAAVADLEEEPLQRRAAHARQPVVLALARSSEAQRLVQLVGSQLDRRRAEHHCGVVVAHSEFQHSAAQGLCNAFAAVAGVYWHAAQLHRVVVLAPLSSHDPHHASVQHGHPETGAWQGDTGSGTLALGYCADMKDFQEHLMLWRNMKHAADSRQWTVVFFALCAVKFQFAIKVTRFSYPCTCMDGKVDWQTWSNKVVAPRELSSWAAIFSVTLQLKKRAYFKAERCLRW